MVWEGSGASIRHFLNLAIVKIVLPPLSFFWQCQDVENASYWHPVIPRKATLHCDDDGSDTDFDLRLAIGRNLTVG